MLVYHRAVVIYVFCV